MGDFILAVQYLPVGKNIPHFKVTRCFLHQLHGTLIRTYNATIDLRQSLLI